MRVNTAELASAIIGHIPTRFAHALTEEELTTKLDELLHGAKDFWEVYRVGLATSEEAARGTAENIQSWIMDKTGTSWNDVNWSLDSAFIEAIERVLIQSKIASDQE